MFKKVLCITASLVLCLSSFIIPSFATTSDSFQDYIDIMPKYDHTSSIYLDISNYQFIYWYSQDRPRYAYNDISNIDDVFVFYVDAADPDHPNKFFTYIASPSQFSIYYYQKQINLNTDGSSLSPNEFSTGIEGTLNSSYNLYVFDFTSSILGDKGILDVDFCASPANGLSIIRNYLDNPPPSDPVYEDLPDFNIQRGYAAYIDFGSDWATRSCSGTFTSTFPQYSSLISGDWDGTDNRRYFWTDSLPSNTSFSSNVGNAIDWTKVAPFDLLQRSKNGIWFIQSNTPLNRYLVIVNPNQWKYGQNPTEDTLNSAITVSDLSGSTGDVKFFALNQQFDQNGTLVSSASDNASNNRTGIYDPDTGTWSSTDSSGNAADQVPGGMSDSPVVSSITDYISNITTILSNFANSVISLIQAPISHVAQLIEAGSSFMGALRGLYGWLPVDIQGLVISALTVVIGIGVFKVFL